MYFSDPALHLDSTLELAWYTGWEELDLYPLLADWIAKAAAATGATRVILTGSSGGGFACMQVSSFLPGSLAVPFSGQTAIANYLVKGRPSAQRKYVDVVMPELAPDGFERLDRGLDWSVSLGARASVLRRYSTPQSNYVLYVQNMNDLSHVNDHYRPFREAVAGWAGEGRIRYWEYLGPEGHNPPDRGTFREVLRAGAEWLETGIFRGEP